MTTTMAEKYTPPEFWYFKPFFTLQPVLETREKQLNCWCSIIINYCTFCNIKRLDPYRFGLFKNPDLGRQLSPAGVESVVNKLIQLGKALNQICS